jgi:hypothetical protein
VAKSECANEIENEINLRVAGAIAEHKRSGAPLPYGWVETVTIAEYKATHTPEQYDLELFRSKHLAAVGAEESAALQRRILLRVADTLYPRTDPRSAANARKK